MLRNQTSLLLAKRNSPLSESIEKLLKGLKSARKRAAFSGKRDELAKRACCTKRVHQYSLYMASRKRKSIGTRPTSQYDTRRFSSLDAWTRYVDNVLGRNILPKRKVELYHTELDDFKVELETHNFHKRLTNLADGSIDLALVKEFYANLFNSKDRPPKQSRVRGALISGQMTSIAQSNTSRLGFPTLITALCGARGVVSDSLTFERLSPVINLAYIRKNCWNPEDLTIFIRGARRARARLTELPSTSIAPTPASTSVAPSVPAKTNSQCFKAMLQSIHQGQIILLQSLQMMAPPDSIPIV
ncbi:hypothetical protein GmHk_07G019737 [Glycine max]|nr:hypothetical protein GmHk_07G019737 [Glycine max]